jgi:hypothetical protein
LFRRQSNPQRLPYAHRSAESFCFLQTDSTHLNINDQQEDGDAQESLAEEGTIGAHFAIPYHVNFGETIKLLGSSEPLGCWDIRKAVQLKWSHSDTWYCDVRLGAGVHEFKVRGHPAC